MGIVFANKWYFWERKKYFVKDGVVQKNAQRANDLDLSEKWKNYRFLAERTKLGTNLKKDHLFYEQRILLKNDFTERSFSSKKKEIDEKWMIRTNIICWMIKRLSPHFCGHIISSHIRSLIFTHWVENQLEGKYWYDRRKC